MFRNALGRISVMLLSVLMTVCMAGSILETDAFAAGGDTVTRAEWLSALVKTFDMTVGDDEDMPDNYFSDLDSSKDYYRDFLVAVEFGLVDVEAGEAVYPEDPVTREFAAGTLNYCLGFQLEDDAEYSFADVDDVSDPVSAQVAVNRNWLKLIGGKFEPETNITVSEKNSMLADAEAVWNSTEVDVTHNNTYKVKSGVKDVPENDAVEMLENGSLRITGSSVQIKENDKFVVHLNDIPAAFTAVSVENNGNVQIIQVEELDVYEAFDELDLEGSLDGNATLMVEPAEDVEMSVQSVPETGKAKLARKLTGQKAPKTWKLAFNGNIDLGGGMYTSFDVSYSNIKIDYKVNLAGESFVKMTGNLKMSCSAGLNMDMLEGMNKTIATVGVPGVGGIDLVADVKLAGKVTVSSSGNLTVGVSASMANGIRAIKSFKSKGFSCVTQVSAYAGVQAQMGITGNTMPIKGYVYAKTGVNGLLLIADYSEGKPGSCVTHAGWLSAEYGAKVSCKALHYDKAWSETIYDMNNSPVRVYHHYEDKAEVARCTRAADFEKYAHAKGFGYYTKWNSPFWTSGWADGMGSYGFDDAGEPVEVYKYEIITRDYVDYAKITGFYGNVRNLTIPDQIDGYKVIAIGNNVFKGLKQIDSVVIGDDIEEIGVEAFSGCTSLSSVHLPNNIKILRRGVFNGDVSLESIEIPKSLEECTRDYNGSWSYSPFRNCENLKTVTFEAGTVRVASGLFMGCTGLEEITIPDTVTSIDHNAFDNAANLKKVTYSKNLKTIGEDAFYGCKSMTGADIPDGVEEIGVEAYSFCTGLNNVHLPKSLKILRRGVFNGDVSLESIEIPKSLEECTRDYNGSWSYSPFRNCENLKTVTFESGRDKIPTGLFMGCTGLEEIAIPETVTSIESYAFENASNLKTVMLKAGLNTIGTEAFRGCSSLENIAFPNEVTSIGNGAFYGCTSLARVKLPPELTVIEAETFYNTSALKSLDWNEKITAIGNYAFAGSGLEETELPESVTKIGSRAFEKCPELKKIIMHNNVQTLGSYMFSECDALTDIIFGTGITEIPQSMFEGCDVLQKISLPYRVTKISGNAFKTCPELTEITMLRNVSSVDNSAFSYAYKMTVYGVAGTYAETFADESGMKFIAIDKPATDVILDHDELTINKGATQIIAMSVTPADFTDEVTWKSSDTNVAVIDSAGKLTAKNVGNATIKINVGNASANCKITVVQPVTGIWINKTSLSMDGGDTFQLTATANPSEAENRDIKWSTTDAGIATVTEDGLVTAVSKGTADVIATSVSNPDVSARCKVTVLNVLYIAETIAELESPHNYENKCTDKWRYTSEGAEALAVTFNEKTEMEDGFDYLYVYNADGSQQGKYTGKELSGRTITITGDTVTIKIESDGGGNEWGFKVDDIKAAADPDAAAQAEADPVIAQINALPDTDDLELSDRAKVYAASEAYAKLSPEAKAKITQKLVNRLNDAVERMKEIEEEEASDELLASETSKLIEALPDTESLTIDDKSVVEEALASYNSLSDEAKALVDADLVEKLESVANRMAEIIEEHQQQESQEKAEQIAAETMEDAENKISTAEAEADEAAVAAKVSSGDTEERISEADGIAANAVEAADNALKAAEKALEAAKTAYGEDSPQAAAAQNAVNSAKALVAATNSSKAEVKKTIAVAAKNRSDQAYAKAAGAARGTAAAVTAAEEAAVAADDAYEKAAEAEKAAIAAETAALDAYGENSSEYRAAKAAADSAIREKESAEAAKNTAHMAVKTAKTEKEEADKANQGNSDPDAAARKVTTVNVNVKTVNAAALNKAIKAAGGSKKYVTTVVLGSKVKKIKSKTFAGTKVTTLTVKTKKLTKSGVKGSLKSSKVKTIKVKAGSKSVNKKLVKKYKKYFTKKNAGKKVTVKK